MLSLAKMTLRRNVSVFMVILGVLIGGTWAIVKITTDYLLYQMATSVARNWAQYLTESATDLEQIAAGEQPSNASTLFFEAAKKSGPVFRFEIFNREGFSQLISDHDKIALVDVSEFSLDAARSIKNERPIVDVQQSHSADLPEFYARAYIPVIVNRRPIAVVAAFVDQTDQRNIFFKTFVRAAAALCALIGLSFGIPAIAWYRRTKETQRVERRIRFLAHHDVLTGLENRASLIDRLSAVLAASAEHGDHLAVHFVDLDRFKEINDRFGHDGGDFLLKTIAERLRAVTRSGDIAARLGGDEFVLVQPGIGGMAQAEEFARRLRSALAEPIWLKEHELFTSVSIGVAFAPADGDTPERLLKSADIAVYKAKAEGRNCVRFFRPEMAVELQGRIELEETIRDAVLRDRFELHYQPIFQMSDRRLLGFEALIRLPKPDGTLIPPLVFIPVAEEMRLIDKIGKWVLREACRTAASWPKHLTIAVNLSPIQFHAGSVSEIVAAALKEAALQPVRLELEITESLLLGDSQSVMAELRKLKELGVSIVMDDFGTGYSSLSYLWRFPFDKIKIDRSFMQGFDGADRDAETVVKTIITLGRELNMHVTIEGVETAKQVAFLDGANGEQAQGFYFGRPMPASELAGSILADFRKGLPVPSSANAQQAIRTLPGRPPADSNRTTQSNLKYEIHSDDRRNRDRILPVLQTNKLTAN
jgi:diguanylate cyclase (GGDEF)-like protein